MSELIKPLTKEEEYFEAMVTGEIGNLPIPLTRTESYLNEIARKPGGVGGGSSIDDTKTSLNSTWSSSKIGASLEDIKNLSISNNEDAQLKIQKALNKKGHIVLNIDGVCLVDNLKIDSDTTLEVYGAIKLKNNSKKFIIENTKRLATDGTYNENITIIGGEWDGNVNNNQYGGPTEKYVDGKFVPYGLVFDHVKNLNFINIKKAGNVGKYTFSLCNIDGFKFEEVHIENQSDGIHLHAPCKNGYIHNITGHTGDNIIGATIGDYPQYRMGDNGDFENITIDGIYSDDGKHPNAGLFGMNNIRFVGCGADGLGVIKGIKVRNLKGLGAMIDFLGCDPWDNNVWLRYTNIQDFLIEDIDMDDTNEELVRVWDKNTIDSLTIRNIRVDKTYTKFLQLIDCRNVNTIKKLTIDGVYFNPSITSTSLASLLKSYSNVLREVIFRDCNLSNSKNVINIFNNSNRLIDIKLYDNFISKNDTFLKGDYNARVLFISNYIDNVNLIDLSNSASVRIISNGNTFVGDYTIINISNNSNISINGDFPYTQELYLLNQLDGDEFNYINKNNKHVKMICFDENIQEIKSDIIDNGNPISGITFNYDFTNQVSNTIISDNSGLGNNGTSENIAGTSVSGYNRIGLKTDFNSILKTKSYKLGVSNFSLEYKFKIKEVASTGITSIMNLEKPLAEAYPFPSISIYTSKSVPDNEKLVIRAFTEGFSSEYKVTIPLFLDKYYTICIVRDGNSLKVFNNGCLLKTFDYKKTDNTPQNLNFTNSILSTNNSSIFKFIRGYVGKALTNSEVLENFKTMK